MVVEQTVFTAHRSLGLVWVTEEMPTGNEAQHGPYMDFADAFEQCFDIALTSAEWRVE